MRSFCNMKSAIHFIRLPLAVLSSLLGTLTVATAQNYSIDWFAIDGGAGTSTGGGYALSGTIGQPDANQQPMTGGNVSLTGGFWSLSAVPRPVGPPLTIQLTTTNTARVFWPWPSTGFVLQQNTGHNTPTWVAPPQSITDNGTIKFIIVPLTGNRFYRLFKP